MNESITEMQKTARARRALGSKFEDGYAQAIAKLQRIADLASTPTLTIQRCERRFAQAVSAIAS